MQKTKLAPAEARLQLNCFSQLMSIGLSTFRSPLGSIWLCGILPEVVPSHFNTYILDTGHTLYSLCSYLFFKYWEKIVFQLEALQGPVALEERDRLSVKGWKGAEGLRLGGMYTPWRQGVRAVGKDGVEADSVKIVLNSWVMSGPRWNFVQGHTARRIFSWRIRKFSLGQHLDGM